MTFAVPVVTLGMFSKAAKVFAIGKGKGLYEIGPRYVIGKRSPIYHFFATGHLVIADQEGMAFSTVGSASAPNSYDTVQRMNLSKQEAPVVFHVTARVAGGVVNTAGEDDITLSGEGEDARLYAVSVLSTTNTHKQAVIFRALDKGPNPAPLDFVDLGENTRIRLANNAQTKHLMVTFEDSYRIGLINANNTLVSSFRHPVQISPISIQVSPDRKKVYVLNFASNTINSIPAERLDPKNQLPLQPLVDYRADVLNAFADLLGGLIQYLKDCFCDHFLVNCPTCDEDDKLFLACITIKNGQVFKVCNFSLRKYVHSFPTIEYWLSVIPVIPLIKKAVETFCCAALPGFFRKFSAFKPAKTDGDVQIADNKLKGARIQQGVTFAQQADFRGAATRAMTTVAPGGKLLTDLVTNKAKQSLVTQPGAIQHADVNNKPADEARKKLEDSNIIVETVQPYDANKAGHNLIRFAEAPPQLQAGMRVNLITKDDKVLFYTLADPSSESVADLRYQIEATGATVAPNQDTI